MDILKMLAELRAAKQQIDEAILIVERLAGGGKRRGRPPKWIAEAGAGTIEPKAKGTMSAAARRKISEAQKRRWAAAKAEANP